jgi:hypothetical protein
MITFSVLDFVLTVVLGCCVSACFGCMITLIVIDREDRKRDALFDVMRQEMNRKIRPESKE